MGLAIKASGRIISVMGMGFQQNKRGRLMTVNGKTIRNMVWANMLLLMGKFRRAIGKMTNSRENKTIMR